MEYRCQSLFNAAELWRQSEMLFLELCDGLIDTSTSIEDFSPSCFITLTYPHEESELLEQFSSDCINHVQIKKPPSIVEQTKADLIEEISALGILSLGYY